MRTKNFPPNPEMHYQRGVAAVEFAFVIVIMLLIMAGMVEFGRTFWYADALTKATRDGARLLSSWPIATLSSDGVGTVKTLVKNSANAANVSPALPIENVTVRCDYSHDYSDHSSTTFSFVTCSPSTAPATVRVSIDRFTITLGDWFPFVGTDGLISFSDITLAPHTTMRYMK